MKLVSNIMIKYWKYKNPANGDYNFEESTSSDYDFITREKNIQAPVIDGFYKGFDDGERGGE